jgi:lipopolysaccharide/colanic/teichoic acid biosynthesis glycosyltransferase
VVRILPPNLVGRARGVRRAFDVAISGVLLAMLSPLIGIRALAGRIEAGPGVILRLVRVGRDGKTFNCLTLRSLRGPRTLRRTSLDELLQLWNVVRGDMSLVGPSPDHPELVEGFSAQYECYHLRQRVRAGLTGFAQVNGLRSDTSIHDRARYDNYYIENWSPWFDIKVCVRALSEYVLARGS